jgi:Lon protease-like protein
MESSAHTIWTDPVPVFPLPNCVLLPGAVLPLHVFEPRYRTMMRDLLGLEPARRAIAVALLRDGFEDVYMTNHAPIHPIVGVGLVMETQELPDGRFNLLLHGRARARISVEDGTGHYRLAMLTPRESTPLPGHQAICQARHRLCSLLTEAASHNLWPAEATEGFFEAFPSTEQLIDVLAFHLIPSDDILLKQQILEEPDVAKRLTLIQDWLKQTIAAHRHATQLKANLDTWPPPCSAN